MDSHRPVLVRWIRKRMTLRNSIIAFVAVVLVQSVVAKEPYVPKSDDEVLETLPKSLISDELTTLRRQLSESPSDINLAVKVAGRYLAMGSLEGDPRFFGYARAALKPWWDQEEPPTRVLRLRAKLREKDHRYDDALVDLRALLDKEPKNSQAWIEVTNILRVQGKYDEAWGACHTLSEFGDEIPNAICRIPLQAATGKAQDADVLLTEILPEARKQFPSVVQWIRTMQSKVAYALGRTDETEQFLRNGLANSPEDKYLIRDYADFLLDQQRNDEVFELVRDHINDNGVLLRGAIAAKRLGKETLAKEWAAQLSTRFEEIRLRGVQPHGRFESRYELEVNNEPKLALRLALTNWEKQKETRDTRNVLEAAIAAGDAKAAQPVVAFLRKHGTEDVVLRDLASKLESK